MKQDHVDPQPFPHQPLSLCTCVCTCVHVWDACAFQERCVYMHVEVRDNACVVFLGAVHPVFEAVLLIGLEPAK